MSMNSKKLDASVILELTSSGELISRHYIKEDGSIQRTRLNRPKPLSKRILDIFLPAGYPNSVSPDYMWYQIFDSLQAFSSAIAGLLASRAVLQGFGVGDSSASPTHALLLTIAQETAGRLTTILAAHHLGTRLSPELKRHRLAADISNDLSLLLDILVPTVSPNFRIIFLCLAGSLRALCGVLASTKAALSVHFARNDNVGDLNAKDGSQETVVGLLGMLAGTYLLPSITGSRSTFFALLILLGMHLSLNYAAVRSVVLTTLNRQRATLVFMTYLTSGIVLSPRDVSQKERIFASGSLVHTSSSPKTLASIRIGVAVPTFLTSSTALGPHDVKINCPSYLLLLIRRPNHSRNKLEISICLEAHVLPRDLLKAWFHAICLTLSSEESETSNAVDDRFATLTTLLQEQGWDIDRDSFVCDSASRWKDVDHVIDSRKTQ